MSKPTLYKRKSLNEVRRRTTTPFTAEELLEANNTVSKFVELFKKKHL